MFDLLMEWRLLGVWKRARTVQDMLGFKVGGCGTRSMATGGRRYGGPGGERVAPMSRPT